MPFVAAVSQHPVVSHAVGEVTGRVLDSIGPSPDLAVLFVGAAGTGALEDIVGAVRALLRPVVLVGCTASHVIGDELEADAGGLALWCGAGFDATASRRAIPPGAAFALADPFTHQTESPITGFASGGRGRGGNRLVLDDELFDDGAVGVSVEGIDTFAVDGRVRDLLERPRPTDGALVFAGDGEPGDAVALSESVGGAALAGIRGAGRRRDIAHLVLFRH